MNLLIRKIIITINIYIIIINVLFLEQGKKSETKMFEFFKFVFILLS